MIAAELPDIDYIYRLGGPLTYFEHHRGWTHALWSFPLQATVVVGFFWVLHRTRHIWKKHRSLDEPSPATWGLLWLMALLSLCSHLFLDWTNTYGVRPLAPFYPRWFSGDLFFIVEPILLLILALALLLPYLLSLIHREIGIRRPRYEGRVLAVVALVLMAGMVLKRILAHADAEALAHAQQLRGGAILHTYQNPYPANSDVWYSVIETRAGLQAGTMNLRSNVFDTAALPMYVRKPDTPVVRAAKGGWLGRVYMDWSKVPLVIDAGPAAYVHPEMKFSAADGAAHVVQFVDLRFKYDTLFMDGATGKTPLSAEVWIDSDLKVRRIYMGDIRQSLPD